MLCNVYSHEKSSWNEIKMEDHWAIRRVLSFIYHFVRCDYKQLFACHKTNTIPRDGDKSVMEESTKFGEVHQNVTAMDLEILSGHGLDWNERVDCNTSAVESLPLTSRLASRHRRSSFKHKKMWSAEWEQQVWRLLQSTHSLSSKSTAGSVSAHLRKGKWNNYFCASVHWMFKLSHFIYWYCVDHLSIVWSLDACCTNRTLPSWR